MADVFRHFFAMRAGRLENSEMAGCILFRSARTESDYALPIQMDGELSLGASRVDIEVSAGGPRVLMPLGSRDQLCSSKIPA